MFMLLGIVFLAVLGGLAVLVFKSNLTGASFGVAIVFLFVCMFGVALIALFLSQLEVVFP
jgi:hypothetical protein